MKKIAFTFISLLLIATTSIAEEAPAQPETSPAPTIEIKNKSSFKMGERNPFWPIGFKPSSTTAGSDSDHAPEIPATAFMVSTITIEKGTRFAIINGKIMQEGQQFVLQMGSSTYQLTVKAIQDGRVVLGRRDQEIVVPLKRK
jgi:hypothetical protein